MIADLKPYSEYKDSGSQWLALVPSHWEVRNLRTLLRLRNERDRADLPLLSVAREKGVFVRSLTDASENHNVIPEDLSNYKVARAGNLVINKMKAWQGSMGIAPTDGIVSPAYFVFEFGLANRAFGQALLRSRPYVAHFAQASDGVRVGQWDLSIAGMRQIPVLVPPSDEQAAIVKYLGWANGRLEWTIRAKRKIIALQEEKKQTIVHRAVTRGLSPCGQLQASGMLWLTEVPAHWSLAPNRSLLRIRKVLVGARHSEYQLLSLTKTGVIVRDMTTAKGKFSNFWERSQEVRPGDLVFCLFDVDETPRTVGLSRHHGMISGDYTVMECSDRLAASFVECFYKAMDDRKLLSPLYTGLRKRISKPLLLAAKTPMPPKCEQADIVRYINDAVSLIDQRIGHLRDEIRLITEYRARLVADVATGKLDVREASAHLPEEVAPDAAVEDDDLSIDPEAVDEEAVV
jgi:type I restriction enzyme S subunit